MHRPAHGVERVDFSALKGFLDDDHLNAWAVFHRSCESIANQNPVLREAQSVGQAFRALCDRTLNGPHPTDKQSAISFWRENFAVYRISGHADPHGNGFLTGYYEPVTEGSAIKTDEFTEPVYGLPDDLIQIPFIDRAPTEESQNTAGTIIDGAFCPYPNRAQIDAGAIDRLAPVLLWLRDGIELFMAQVQGSARVVFRNGRQLRLIYAGRNGRPYSSIGRILIDSGKISARDMSLQALKEWVRSAGQHPGQAGRLLMQQNQSYVFFKIDNDIDVESGPVGGQGVPLTALRSIAVDRNVWPYGLPFWIDARLPWQTDAKTPFSRLMIAQDTGSAILGSARVDLFFGSGDEAGRCAGNVRHEADVYVLLPREETGL